jgi:hypothetical protein
LIPNDWYGLYGGLPNFSRDPKFIFGFQLREGGGGELTLKPIALDGFPAKLEGKEFLGCLSGKRRPWVGPKYSVDEASDSLSI